MTALMRSLGIDRLPLDEQVLLAHDILESVAAAGPPPISPELRAELRRRVAEAKATPEDSIPWEEVEAAARARLRHR